MRWVTVLAVAYAIPQMLAFTDPARLAGLAQPAPGVRPAPAPPGGSRPASPGFYARSGGRPSSRRSGEKSTPRHQAQADRQHRSPTKPRKPPNAAIIVPVTWRQSGATKKKCRLETTVNLTASGNCQI